MLNRPKGLLTLVFAVPHPQVNTVGVIVDITMSDEDGHYWHYSAPYMQGEMRLAHPAQELRFREWCDAAEAEVKNMCWSDSYYYRDVTKERMQEAYLQLMSPSGFVKHVVTTEREVERDTDARRAAMWKELGDAP